MKQDSLINFTVEDLLKQKPALDRYALLLTRKGNNWEDLVQDVLLRAVQKQHLFKKDSNLRSWLLCMMHNKFVSNLSAEKRRVQINLKVNVETSEAYPDRTMQSDLNILIRDVTNALESSPKEQVEVIKYINIQGMNYQECAEVLDIPIGTVRSRLARAKQNLRKVLY